MINTAKRVPLVLQMEALECGAASLAMVLAYYKRYIPLEQMRMDCGVSRDGSKAGNLIRAAIFHGMKAKGYKYSAEQLKELHTLPAILHWNFNHFVVFCGFRGKRALINDPASGVVSVPMEEFERSFTGVVLIMEPGEKFEPCGKPRSAVAFLQKYLASYQQAAMALVICGLLIAITSMTLPIFSRIFMDDVLLDHAQEWMGYLTKAMLAVLVLLFGMEVCLSIVSFRARQMMGLRMNMTFLWHTLQLPAAFFSQRSSGDIAARQADNDLVASAVFDRLVPIGTHMLMTVVYFTLLCYLEPTMALAALAAMLLQILTLWISSLQLADENRAISRDQGKYHGCAVSSISMIETIKASGAEMGCFGKLSGYYAKYSNSVVCLKKKLLTARLLPDLLHRLCDAAILMLGVFMIMDGSLTIGLLLAFQGFLQSFLSPIQEFFVAGEELQGVAAKLERIEDVLAYPVDPSFSSQEKLFNQEKETVLSNQFCQDTKDTTVTKLAGRLELQNVSFAYGRLAQPFIENFNLTVEPGQMVALVGGSGSGKSTLTNLITGLYGVRSGKILFDGRERAEIDRYLFTQSVSVVSQNISLFKDTVRNNLTLWDNTVEEQQIMEACRVAGIYQDIMARSGGLDFVLSEDGKNLSGGQRQRLEIARALLKSPSLLILDEATSALDPPTEKQIMDAIREKGMTCIMIAHRLSTIRNADNIVVLKHGHIAEVGNHETLLAAGGLYAELIQNE